MQTKVAKWGNSLGVRIPQWVAEKADIVLPGVSFAEKDGTFTNTERRVQRVRKAISNIGDARQDWEII
jgi:formate dehydrogenase major subunit